MKRAAVSGSPFYLSKLENELALSKPKAATFTDAAQGAHAHGHRWGKKVVYHRHLILVGAVQVVYKGDRVLSRWHFTLRPIVFLALRSVDPPIRPRGRIHACCDCGRTPDTSPGNPGGILD